MPTRSDLLPGTLELLVLKALSLDAMHGYGIAQHLRQVSDDVIMVEEGSLYPALQRLLVKGWVTAEWRVTPTGRRGRYYQLTPAGRRQLAQELTAFEALVAGMRRVLEA